MSGLGVNFRKTLVDTKLRTGGEQQTVGSFNGHQVKALPENDNTRFRKQLVELYGERVTQWAFSGHEKRVLNPRPLSDKRMQQIIDRAEELETKTDTKLQELLPEWAPSLLERSLNKAGIEWPDQGREGWQELLTTMVEDEIRRSSKFQDPQQLGNLGFDGEFQDVVDKFVEDHKEALKNIAAFEAKRQAMPQVPVGDDYRMKFLEGYKKVSNVESYWKEKIVAPMLQQVGLHNGFEPQPLSPSEFCNYEKMKKLGGGGFSEVFLAKVDGEECVVKELVDVQVLSLERTDEPNEAMGSYLTPKDGPDYLSNKVNIAQPTFYLISVLTDGARKDMRVDPHEMRELVKEGMETGSTVVCHGLVMPRAKGEEVNRLIRAGKFTEESEKKQFIKSTLESIKGLNERGFVHRDLKSQNTYFDKETGTTTLIDTGSLFKVPEDKDSQKHPQYIGGDFGFGTRPYMHPRALHHEKHGTETDLYALGIMTLEVDHPMAFNWLKGAIELQNYSDGVSKDWLIETLNDKIDQLDDQIKKSGVGTQHDFEVLQDLETLRNDLDNPNKLSSFALQCFEKAGEPAERWNDREWSQQTYSELLLDSRLQ
jgi:serine/threonine protein kinase